MNATPPRCGVALLMAVVSAGVWAGGDPPAQMVPDPPNVRSVYSPGEDAGTPVTERSVVTDDGVVRVRGGAPEAPAQPAAPAGSNGTAPSWVTVQGGGGQVIRVVPGAQPDLAAPAVPMAMPADLVVVEAGGAKMLRRPGTANDLPSASPQTQAAPSAKPPPGMRIVDLPAGAVAPIGMPEPMTLYRATSAPMPAVPLPAARAPD